MKKQFLLLSLILIMSLALSGCGCEHEWSEATCTSEKICKLCSEVEGVPLGHTWISATCETPKTCSRCKLTEGNPSEHSWETDRKICTVCGVDKRPVDEKFVESLTIGLESRWKLTEAKDKTGENALKSDWENYFNAELEQIAIYENESFDNKDLEKWAKKYIDSIKESIEVLAYYGTNQWTSKYSNGVYHDRSIALYNIHEIVPIPVSDKNQTNLLNIISNGEVVSTIRPLMKKVKFEEVENSYGWKTYQAVVKNTTSQTFTYFTFDIDLIDEDGVTISTESTWVDNWNPDEKIRFEFSTDEDFAEMKIGSASWNY